MSLFATRKPKGVFGLQPTPRLSIGRRRIPHNPAEGSLATAPIRSETAMVDRRIGVIINGATGRMGTTQHMANLLAIAHEGGLQLRNGDRLIPDLLLVGRDAGRLQALAQAQGDQRWTTSLDEAL